MRHLVWYIRSMFCRHDWDYEERFYTAENLLEQRSSGYIVSATCKTCGWHRSYKKF